MKCNAVLIPVSANHCYAKTAVLGFDLFFLGGSNNDVRKIPVLMLDLEAPGKI